MLLIEPDDLSAGFSLTSSSLTAAALSLMGEEGSLKEMFEMFRPPGMILLGLFTPVSSSFVKLSWGKKDCEFVV